MNIIYYLIGYADVAVYGCDRQRFLNLCMYLSIPYTAFENISDDGIRLRVKLIDMKRLLRECERHGIDLKHLRYGGLPIIASRYKNHPGLLLGCVMVIFMIFCFNRLLWDVRVIGNEEMTSSEITDILRSHGVRVGSDKKRINCASIENDILIERSDISWISINVQGNIAYVEVRENKSTAAAESKKFANVTAKKSGVVEYTSIYRGNTVVKAGQYVEKGQLLISGIYDSERVGFRFTRASGKVMARTVEEINVKIPLEYDKKVYSGSINYEKSLNFLGFPINISKKGGKTTMFCDTICNVESFGIGDKIRSPIELCTVEYHEYEYVKSTRTEDEARELAYFRLSEEIRALGDIEILKKNISIHVTGDVLLLTCTLTCIEDIAQTSEFDVDLTKR